MVVVTVFAGTTSLGLAAFSFLSLFFRELFFSPQFPVVDLNISVVVTQILRLAERIRT